jgi:hypothetical protein
LSAEIQLAEDECKIELAEQLRDAQRARCTYRLRVTVIPFTLGIACGLAGMLLLLLSPHFV